MSDKFRDLKNAFGRFATGIAIASCRTEAGSNVALTINSFTSVSLDPALVLWCIENKASAFPAFMAADSYAISILRADQQAYSDRFARFEPKVLAPDESETWVSGAPVLKEKLAGFDCRIVARHKAGDHVILVGEVLRFESEAGEPLVYVASNYHKGAGHE